MPGEDRCLEPLKAFSKKIKFGDSNISSSIVGLDVYMAVSKNSGTPKSSILIGFSITNHPFWGTPIFGNTHIASLRLVRPTFFSEPQVLGWENDPPRNPPNVRSDSGRVSVDFSQDFSGRVEKIQWETYP